MKRYCISIFLVNAARSDRNNFYTTLINRIEARPNHEELKWTFKPPCAIHARIRTIILVSVFTLVSGMPVQPVRNILGSVCKPCAKSGDPCANRVRNRRCAPGHNVA
jgi:hypothetical protein